MTSELLNQTDALHARYDSRYNSDKIIAEFASTLPHEHLPFSGDELARTKLPNTQLVKMLHNARYASNNKCTCFPVEPKYWTIHFGAVEPGSTMELNPQCPVHGTGGIRP